MEDVKDMKLQNQSSDTVDNNTGEKDKNDPKYRGNVLMQRALEHLEKGEMEEFETDRALANKYFDKMNSEIEELNALYNESRNFGIIYQVIEANVPALMESAVGQNSLRKIVKMIKEDKILHEQFKVYNNLLPHNKVINVTEYINEAISMIPTMDKDKIKESNDKLIKLIKGEKLDEMVDINEDKINIFENIEYLILNKKTLQNIDEYTNAKNTIAEAIEKLPIKSASKAANIEDYAKEMNAVSENVAKELNTDEINLIKRVHEGNAENYFNECKGNTLSKLNEMMVSETDIENKSRLSRIYEQFNNKTYNKNTALVDIAEMIEMQNTIDE